MFDFEGLSGYDVQETRRVARLECMQEAEQERQKAEQERQKALADYLRSQGLSDEIIKGALSVQPK
jgi:hypothetical protein